MNEGMVNVQASDLKELVIRRMVGAGTPADEAQIVADVLVFADLRGTKSHGVLRVEHYENRIRHGGINLAPELRVDAIRPAIAIIDAQGGMGHVAAKRATEEAIRRAKEHGIGVVGVKNSSHCGALAYYVDLFGGTEPYFGTNPFAFGFPGKTQSILLDMATSEVAFGKIFYAREKNVPIPEGWAVDKAGAFTTDPHAAYALFPFGGVKGYGINMMVEALTGLLVGGVFGPHVTPMYDQLDSRRNLSSFHLVIDPSLFNGEAVFSHTQAMIDELHAQSATAESGAVRVPGEIEAEAMKRALVHGIDIPDTVYCHLTGAE